MSIDMSKSTDKSPIGTHKPSGVSFTNAGLICLVWIVGVAISLMFWVSGIISLGTQRRQASSASDERLERSLRSAMARIGVKRMVRVLLSEHRSMPMQWGVLRPTILLPTAATKWGSATVEAVLSHELAHVRRLDGLARNFVLLSRSLFWFNPLIWWASHLSRRECERACDDLLLTTGSDPCDYADALLFVTEFARDSRRVMFAALGMSSPSELERRIHGILDRNQRRSGMTRPIACVLISAFTFVLGSAAVLRGRSESQPQSIAVNPLTTDSGTLVRVSHVDDSAEGYRSIAGSGHAVRFDRPDKARRVAAVELFASRYGTVDPPDEDFHIYLLDENRTLIAAYPIAYSRIVRGVERWHTIPIAACEVPQRFHVAVVFNPHRTKGIYLGYDAHAESSNSLIGRPTTGFQSVDERREWMIRTVMIDHQQPTNPFEDSKAASKARS